MLDELPPRVLRFRLRLLKLTYNTVDVPGKQLIVADTLPQAPVRHVATQQEEELESDVQIFVDSIRQTLPATETRLQQLAPAQKDDSLCCALRQFLPPCWCAKDNMSVVGDLLLKGQKTVIPSFLKDHHRKILSQGPSVSQSAGQGSQVK